MFIDVATELQRQIGLLHNGVCNEDQSLASPDLHEIPDDREANGVSIAIWSYAPQNEAKRVPTREIIQVNEWYIRDSTSAPYALLLLLFLPHP